MKKDQNLFTDKYLTNLKAKAGQVKPIDKREKSGNGFGLTLFPSGRISFIYIYYFEGRKRRMTLGRYPHLTLKNAKKAHRLALKMIEDGKDPAVEKKKTKLETRNASTIESLIEEYLNIWAKPRKRSWEEDQRILYKDVYPAWGKRKAIDISKRDVILLLEIITKRGAPIGANRTLACIRRMFNFGIERDLIHSNPCIGIKAPSKESRREYFLSNDEIKIFWHSLNEASMSELTKLALKLQLITAQRKGEIVSSEWKEIDFINKTWTIPSDKTKNSKAHRVPLSKFAIEILLELQPITGQSRWLFPAPSSRLSSLTIELVTLLKEIKGNILFANWDEIDIENGIWTVPVNKSLDGKKHALKLSNRAIELLKKLKEIRKKYKEIFPRSLKAKKFTPHMTGEAVDHAVRRSKQTFQGLNNFTPHTLRATATSHMAAMRISGEVLSRILNHSKKGVTEQHYNKYDYDDEKRNALDSWSNKLKEIINNAESSTNVIQFKNVI